MDAHNEIDWRDRVLLWLLAGVIGYGLALVIAGGFIGDEMFDRLGFGPADGDIEDGVPRDYVRFVYGVLGAVIVGWMTAVSFVARGPLRRREEWSWWAIAASLGIWFVLDTGLSLVLGFVGHAAFNVVFAMAFAVPLGAIRSEIHRTDP